jgi:hypothetical protein
VGAADHDEERSPDGSAGSDGRSDPVDGESEPDAAEGDEVSAEAPAAKGQRQGIIRIGRRTRTGHGDS